MTSPHLSDGSRRFDPGHGCLAGALVVLLLLVLVLAALSVRAPG